MKINTVRKINVNKEGKSNTDAKEKKNTSINNKLKKNMMEYKKLRKSNENKHNK